MPKNSHDEYGNTFLLYTEKTADGRLILRSLTKKRHQGVLYITENENKFSFACRP